MANIREGARRMRRVGNVIVLMAVSAAVLFGILKTPFFLFALPWLPVGALIWAAGWILEGFAD